MSGNVATVAKLYLYPVKSMAAVSVEGLDVVLDGIVGDRQYAFVRTEQAAKNDFPWMTARQDSRLLSYELLFYQLPTLDEPEPMLRVHTPHGRLVDVLDASFGNQNGPGRFLVEKRSGYI